MTPLEAPDLLVTSHETAEFRSGDQALDQWLQRYALANQGGGGARTYVVARGRRVVGYYALSASSVEHGRATRRVAHGAPRPVPAVLLGRLAVAAKEQGQGLGRSLLRDAVLRTLSSADSIGIRVMLVNAVDEDAARWYRRFGFEPSPTDPLHLMLLLKDARANLPRSS